jgi:iron complex transport system ATP-binding protein
MENCTSKNHIIALQNLTIGYPQRSGNEHTVFGPVNIAISAAEMTGIIGRNGIGKSTLLRTIAGLQPQLRGKVFFDGIENTSIQPNDMAKLVSFVSTEPINIHYLRVNELVAMGRFPYTGWLGKLDDTDLKFIDEAAELTGITHLMLKCIQELSDGERQKVMIARALAQDTPIIILDEPTAFLDLPARYDIMRILNNLTLQYNKTILFTTHDLAIAMDIADKLWVMTEGILYEGAPEDLLINKVFRKLFLNSAAEFDAKSFSFRLKKEMKNVVLMRGEKRYMPLTKKAMERIGFLTVEKGSSAAEIIILDKNNAPVWQLLYHETDNRFDSIYTLTTFLKKNALNNPFL